MMTNTLADYSVVFITALKSFFNTVATNRSKRYKIYALIYKKKFLTFFSVNSKLIILIIFPEYKKTLKHADK